MSNGTHVVLYALASTPACSSRLVLADRPATSRESSIAFLAPPSKPSDPGGTAKQSRCRSQLGQQRDTASRSPSTSRIISSPVASELSPGICHPAGWRPCTAPSGTRRPDRVASCRRGTTRHTHEDTNRTRSLCL